jgi:hypothetical protein
MNATLTPELLEETSDIRKPGPGPSADSAPDFLKPPPGPGADFLLKPSAPPDFLKPAQPPEFLKAAQGPAASLAAALLDPELPVSSCAEELSQINDSLERRESLLAASAKASRLLLEAADVRAVIPNVLQVIGEAARVD